MGHARAVDCSPLCSSWPETVAKMLESEVLPVGNCLAADGTSSCGMSCFGGPQTWFADELLVSLVDQLDSASLRPTKARSEQGKELPQITRLRFGLV